MITARGVGFLVAAIGLFFLGSATSVGWVRMVDAVLWGMLGLSLILQWLSIVSVSARRRLVTLDHSPTSTRPREDDDVEIELELHNVKFWPRYFLSVAYDCSFADPQVRSQRYFVANLSGHGKIQITSRLRCYRRGLHRLGTVTVESKVPFGLFRRRRHLDAPLSVLVYPQVLPLERLALLQGSAGMTQQPRLSRTGQEIAGSRPYVPGDSPRHIHWRNSARLGELAVKELEDTTERSVTIVFDTGHELGEGRETTLEYSIKLAASIGLFTQRSATAVRIIAGSFDEDWSEPGPLLKALAMLEAGDSPPLADLLDKVPSGSPSVAMLLSNDIEGARALSANAFRLPGLVAVVFEGFYERSESGDAAETLHRAGISTIVCRQGHLEEALGALGQQGLPQGRTKFSAQV